MKILVITQYYYPEPFRINSVCEALVSKGHQVTVFTTLPNYPYGTVYPEYISYNHKYELINGVSILRIKSRPRKKGNVNLALNFLSFALRGGIAAFNVKNDYDIIYVYQLSPIFSAIPGIILKKLHNKPLYLYCLDLWPESIKRIIRNDKSFFFKCIKVISKWVYSNSDRIGVTSKPFIDYFTCTLGLKSVNIEYIPQYAEDIQVNECTDSIDNNCIDFVFLGNVGLSQNLNCVADAVKLVKTKKNYIFHIVGTGSTYESLVKHIKEIGIEDKFVFHGRHPVSEMPKFYRLADICLLSLVNDNAVGMTVPGKLQGYMSAGKAILASIDGAAAEIIEKAKCGLRVKANDSEALAEAITLIIENPELIKKYEKNSRDYFKKHFSREIHITKLEKSLISLITDKSKQS